MFSRRRRGTAADMPLVARVLEMLRTAFPSFEIDLEDLRSTTGEPEPERDGPGKRAGRRRAERPRSRPRPAPGPRPSKSDTILRRSYAHLGVPLGADIEAVRSAWRRLVREHHPDRHAGHPELQQRGSERVKEINRAYEEIKRRLGRRR